NSFKGYVHKLALCKDVEKANKLIYEHLTNRKLLKRCFGGHADNNNEGYNAFIRQIALKHLHSGPKCIAVAAFLYGCAAVLPTLHHQRDGLSLSFLASPRKVLIGTLRKLRKKLPWEKKITIASSQFEEIFRWSYLKRELLPRTSENWSLVRQLLLTILNVPLYFQNESG
ncbi:hypothetical protein WH47_00472, partial [Habropoda laboriosa]